MTDALVEKACRNCGEVRSAREFYKNDLTASGLHSWCRPCCVAAASERQKRLKSDPEWRREQTARLRRWRKENPEAAAAQRERGVERNRQYITRLKDQTPCADCGGSFPKPIMEFHHVRGKKLSTVSTLVARAVSLERLKAEIAKCDLVCANCHRIRHHAEKAAA
jgi:hypothetical protein